MVGYTRVGNSFRRSSSTSSIDQFIRTIRDLVHSGKLHSGDRLPSETVLQSQYGMNRHHVRQALQLLELYGIVRIIPQSGTYLTNLGPKAIESLIDNVLSLNEPDFESLADTRAVLEIRAAELAASKSGPEEVRHLEEVLQRLREQVEQGERGLEEDYALHLKIAQLSKSTMLTSLIGMIVPLCLEYSQSVRAGIQNARRALSEHEAIVEAIRAGDSARAASAMRLHMEATFRATLALMGGRGAGP